MTKPKLPKGLSYPLKTSQLEGALAEAGIDCHIDLVYWQPQGGDSILEAHYWPPNENVPRPRVYVRSGTVPSALRSVASEALTGSAIPEFIDWFRGVLALPDGSPALQETLYFDAAYTEDGLVVTYHPKSKVRQPKR